MLTQRGNVFLLALILGFLPDITRAQEGADKLIVHVRSSGVTLNHTSLKEEGFSRRIAASLQKIEGVTQTRVLLASGMVEVRFDRNKITGEQVASAAKTILEDKLRGRKIEVQALASHKANSKIVVKALSDNQVQLTSERFY